ncbi:MAG: DUF1592 domain-containing protein [Verrucomicrobiota bacterium]
MNRSPLFAVLLLAQTSAFAADTSGAILDQSQRTFLKEHCVECHGAEKQKGKLRLDDIFFGLDTVERADQWQKILNQVNSGEMPPDDAKQPGANLKADFLEALSQTLVKARHTLGDSRGKIVVRRLNRREYKNTIRDLLGVEIDVRDLPSDGGAGTFDTVGSSLFMSSEQVEQYLALGRRALDDAFEVHATHAKSFKIHTEMEKVADSQLRSAQEFLSKKLAPYRQWIAAVDASCENPENQSKAADIRKLDEVTKEPQRFYRHWAELRDAPSPVEFGLKDAAEGEFAKQHFDETSNDVASYFQLPHVDKGSYLFVFILRPQESVIVPKNWPPGQYTLRVRIAGLQDTSADRHFIEVGHPSQPGAFDIISTHQVTGTIEQPQTIEVPVTLTSTGSRTFAIREKRLNSREHEVDIAVGYRNKHKTWYPPAMWIDWMELEADRRANGPQSSAPELFEDRNSSIPEREQARQIVERFSLRAFRQIQPEPGFCESLVERVFMPRRNAGESFESALKATLSVVLAAPGFLYRPECTSVLTPVIAEKNAHQSAQLSGYELATRLSYFLWSAPPDPTLLSHAQSGTLFQPEVLSCEVDRLLASPKSREFVTGFVQQWLGLDRLDFFRFNAKLFPKFDDSVKMAARSEVFETFSHLVRNRGSLKDLLKSNQVVINGLLANFYGIEGVSGDAFRPVFLGPESPRGGLLGMSAIMAMGSNGERTSPVERGAWVLRKLLHDPPPPAPPNVPQLSRLSSEALSPRERVLAHQEEAQCRQCHRKIDPIGFGLENFNATGQWRTTELYTKAKGGRKDWPIDPSGAFYKGPEFHDFFELREHLASRADRFARGFSESLVEYALGRPFSSLDEPLVAEMIHRATGKELAVREFVHALVTSREFQSK